MRGFRDSELPQDELDALRREAMDFAGIGLCRYTLDFKVIFVDRVALRIIELDERYPDPAKAKGISLANLFTPVTSAKEVIREIRSTGRVRNAEFAFKTLGGKIRWIVHDTYLVQDVSTGAQAFQAVFRDITPRKRLEEARQLDAARHRELIERLNDGFAVIMPDGRLEYANARLAEMGGYSLEELMQLGPRDLLDEQGLAIVAAELQRRKNGEGGHYELDLICKDGRRVQTLVAAVPLFDDEGGFKGSFAVFSDVSALKRAQEQYRLLFETMLHAFALLEIVRDEAGVTQDFRFLEINPPFERICGITASEIQGQSLSTLLPEGEQIPEELMAQVAQTGESTRFERFLPSLNRYFEGILYCPQPDRLALILADVTDRKQLESKLRQADKLQAIGTLASGVAHEINTPLNVIMNYAELLRRYPTNVEKLESYTTEISNEAQRVADIVRDLLSFSRQAREERSTHEVEIVVKSTVSLVRKVLMIDNILLRVELPPDLPLISCRQQQIQQVLVNLITNARDALNEIYPGAHPDKTIEITGSTLEQDDERWVRISVEDRGMGIPPGIVGQIFDPFFTTKPASTGTGLGLAVCQGIIDEHQGRIWLESEPGAPTRFHVELPSADQSPQAPTSWILRR